MLGPYRIPQHAHGSLLTRKKPMWQVARDGTDVTRGGWGGASSPAGPRGERGVLGRCRASRLPALSGSTCTQRDNPRCSSSDPRQCRSKPWRCNSGSWHCIARSSHGIACPDCGTTHPNRSVARPNHSVAHPNRSIACPNRGIAHPNRGIAHPNRGIAHPRFGVAGLATAPHTQLKPLPPPSRVLQQISPGGWKIEAAPRDRGSEGGRLGKRR